MSYPYVFYTTILVVPLLFVTALYFSRGYWAHLVPEYRGPGSDFLYSSLPTTFNGDVEAGLSSSTFDLSENVDGKDERAGLDDRAKAEILKIMKRKLVVFDEARRFYIESRFTSNGISPDGTPRDAKFVSFS